MTIHPQPSNLFASIDMGTHSFKLVIVYFDPTTSKFTTFLRRSHPVVIGLDSSSSSPPLISPDCETRAIEVLRKFRTILCAHNVRWVRAVATSAIREAGNGSSFVNKVRENLGFDFEVNVLSGVEEAKLSYLGVLQFLPVHEKRVLTLDIGGGSTEFVIADHGEVLFAESLKLGHVTLTQKFGEGNLLGLRAYIRERVGPSGLVDKLKDLGFEVAIGSSGTIRDVAKAIWSLYGSNEGDNLRFLGDGAKRNLWWFDREEVTGLVERSCGESEKERSRRDGVFRKRSEYIVAGVVLLEVILDLLGIRKMQVSGYALAEGIVAQMISEACVGCDLNANVKWKSVVRLAMSFNGSDRMNASGQCTLIAKHIFEGLRKYKEVDENQSTSEFFLDDKDLEYLEAACMLHNIGLYLGKKGYHKRSCSFIMEYDQLDGYTVDEIQLIALLVKHHRKKFITFHGSFLHGFEGEKIGILCSILRLSVIFQKLELKEIKLHHSCEGFMLGLVKGDDQPLLPDKGSTTTDIEKKFRKEEKNFEVAFHQKLLVIQTGYSQPSADNNVCF